MKLGTRFVESVLNIIYNCILIFSFCLMSLVFPKFHNHVYINFALTKCLSYYMRIILTQIYNG